MVGSRAHHPLHPHSEEYNVTPVTSLIPGDKFFHVTMRTEELVLIVRVQCVRVVILPGKNGSPSSLSVLVRDTDKKNELWLSYTEKEQVLMLPKPNKIKQMWSLLRC